MNMFIILIAVMVSQLYRYLKLIRWYTLNLCSLFDIKYTSEKQVWKIK